MPRHVFISYSRANSDFVARLSRDLEARGIGVWVDIEGLQPGTPNWEKSIREAISRAFAMIFVASPDSAQSNPVHGELSIAKDSSKTIIPVWAMGDQWSSCAPFDMMRAQYVDLRDSQYAANLDQLIDAIERQRPQHMLFESNIPPHDYLSILPPQGYFRVGLGDFGQQNAVAFKATTFSSMSQFLNLLYTTYLRGAVAPLSYGSEWILASDAGPDQLFLAVRRLGIPFSWFLLAEDQRKQPITKLDSHWADGSLESFGLRNTTSWQVMRIPEVIFGIVTDDSLLAAVFESITDSRFGKIIEVLMTEYQPEERSETHARCQYRFVLSHDGRDGRSLRFSEKILVAVMRDYYKDFIPKPG